eukprot:gene24547-biopygen13458
MERCSIRNYVSVPLARPCPGAVPCGTCSNESTTPPFVQADSQPSAFGAQMHLKMPKKIGPTPPEKCRYPPRRAPPRAGAENRTRPGRALSHFCLYLRPFKATSGPQARWEMVHPRCWCTKAASQLQVSRKLERFGPRIQLSQATYCTLVGAGTARYCPWAGTGQGNTHIIPYGAAFHKV